MAQTSKAVPTTTKRAAKVIEGTKATGLSEERMQALALYESALRLMQEGKYDKAHAAFNTMLATSPHDLADRIRVYLNACLLKINKGTVSFESHEERYDYAISLLNQGKYAEAREHFRAILSEDANADYAFYGLAVLASLTGDSHECLEYLTEAIQRNPKNRIQARADGDFQDMADDPRFTELLYPEA